MKVDLSPKAVSARLRQVEALRRLCLSLARSGVAGKVARECPANERVQRTRAALGTSHG